MRIRKTSELNAEYNTEDIINQ